jgi:hypothetical protein
MKEAFAMKRGELSKVLALLWAFICIVYAAPALAQPITVTTSADESDFPSTDCTPPGNNDCSLREAIIVANSGDVIVFDSSLDGTTITLNPALGGLSITESVTINAASLTMGITIDANGIAFPLTLNSNTIVIQGPITITGAGAGGAAVVLNPGADGSSLVGITVSNNAGVGISIGNVNNVVLDGVTVDNNPGGGITAWNSSASGIQIKNNCIVRYNNPGTGIYINASGTFISGCTVERNGSGGISVDSGGVGTTVSSTTIRDNIGGSGIYSKAQITVTGSTIINNNPGGISLDVGADNSLILGSDISDNPGGSGIFLNGVSNITIGPNNTISYNFAEGVNVRNSSLVNINNSTISNNGQNGLSSGVFIFGTSTQIAVSYNVIDNNAGNGVTVHRGLCYKGRSHNDHDQGKHDLGQWLCAWGRRGHPRSPGPSLILE